MGGGWPLKQNDTLGIYLPPKHVLRCIERQAAFYGLLCTPSQGPKKESVFAYILTTDKAIIMKLHRNIKQVKIILDNSLQLGDKMGVTWVTWPTFKFWDLLYISGMAKARNLKLGVPKDYYEYYSKDAKLEDKRSVAYVTWPTFKFWDPSISPEPLKLETWNLLCR